MKKEEVTRKEKAILYCIQMANKLKKKGILKGGNLIVNPDYLYLIDGFMPTEQEIEEALNALEAAGHIKRTDPRRRWKR